MRYAGMRRATVAVVGAGPAGLAVSRGLALHGVDHVVLERGRIASTWRNQRWDSFRLNTPGWANRIPGAFLLGPPDGFATAADLVAGLERYAAGLPVVEGAEVLQATRARDSWFVETTSGLVVARDVVVASGFQNVPRRPALAAALPDEIEQRHVGEYRRPEDHDGAVLVVGGGQSGVQVAADLLRGGRRVYLATSRVGRLPRRHRGRDAFEWMRDTGQLDLPRDEVDSSAIGTTSPQISGASGGRTVSYQQLAEAGATLLGRAVGWDGRRLELAQDVGENVRFADEAAEAIRTVWDRHAARASGEIVPAWDRDPADEPAEHLYGLTGPRSLDLAAAGISTVVWATGFYPSTRWLPPRALDERRRPRLPGLHVIGSPWLTHRASGNLYGIATDAERLAAHLAAVSLGAAVA